MSATVSAVFAGRDQLLQAIEECKERGLRGLEVMMPVPDHEILEALPAKPTRINWLFSLWGGLFGVALGFGFPAWAHAHIYRQITGGKPVVSWPPFFVPGFEMLVLFTGILTMIGIHVMCRLPRLRPDPHFDPRVTEDHYVLVVTAPEERAPEATSILRAAGGEVK